jgi:hypothetical protein
MDGWMDGVCLDVVGSSDLQNLAARGNAYVMAVAYR